MLPQFVLLCLITTGNETNDVFKYHVVLEEKTLDQHNKEQVTFQGGTLTSYFKFQKIWLNLIVIGL